MKTFSGEKSPLGRFFHGLYRIVQSFKKQNESCTFGSVRDQRPPQELQGLDQITLKSPSEVSPSPDGYAAQDVFAGRSSDGGALFR